MEDTTYRELEFISHSALCSFERIINGEPDNLNIKEETLEAGRQLHMAALEPEKYNIELDSNAANTRNMIRSLKENIIYNYLRNHHHVKTEWPHLWTCQHTGVKCKGKFDMEVLSNFADLKGTSCKTKEEFISVMQPYNYHMQAAFYLDGGHGEKFTFIGVQKKYPFKTFTHVFSKNDPLIEQGREKYIYLIRAAIAKGMLTTKFITGATAQPENHER